MTAPPISTQVPHLHIKTRNYIMPKRLLSKLLFRHRHCNKQHADSVESTSCQSPLNNNMTETSRVRIMDDGDDTIEKKIVEREEGVTATIILLPLEQKPERQRNMPVETVHFDETHNTTLPSPAVSSACTWYTTSEIMALHQQFFELIQTLRVDYKHQAMLGASSSSSCWMGHLRRVHQSFCNITSLERKVHPHRDIELGMERWAVPGVLPDIESRRRRLCRVALQRHFQHAESVARQCRNISLPSRLYARHVADQLVASLCEEDDGM